MPFFGAPKKREQQNVVSVTGGRHSRLTRWLVDDARGPEITKRERSKKTKNPNRASFFRICTVGGGTMDNCSTTSRSPMLVKKNEKATEKKLPATFT